MTDLLNVVGIPCCSSRTKDKSTCETEPKGMHVDELENVLDQFSEDAQEPLTEMDRRIIRDFELETARARAVGCGARLVYPLKGSGNCCFDMCTDRRSTPQNVLLRRWVEREDRMH